jgi:hypothetical protein
VLWHAAVRDGLVAELGADEVQRLLADAFAPERDDLSWSERGTADAWDDPAWEEAAHDYHEARGDRVSIASYTPEELARYRRLLEDDVSLERAWREMNKPPNVPIVTPATLEAAEYLHDLGDLESFKRWFDRHSAAERAAIFRHLDERKKGRGK